MNRFDSIYLVTGEYNVCFSVSKHKKVRENKSEATDISLSLPRPGLTTTIFRVVQNNALFLFFFFSLFPLRWFHRGARVLVSWFAFSRRFLPSCGIFCSIIYTGFTGYWFSFSFLPLLISPFCICPTFFFFFSCLNLHPLSVFTIF